MDYMQEQEARPRNGGTLRMVQAGQAVRQQGRIGMHVEARQKLQSILEQAINSLEQRLNPILQQNPPAPSDPKRDARAIAGLADVMEAQNAALESAVHWLNHIIERIEL
jgi:uncharacterized protein YecE (DUF72 family)